MCWTHKVDFTEEHIKIPFGRNTGTMPPEMTFEEQTKLVAFKTEIVEATKEEIAKTCENRNFRKNKPVIQRIKRFLEANNLIAVPSHKSNRLVVTHSENYNK